MYGCVLVMASQAVARDKFGISRPSGQLYLATESLEIAEWTGKLLAGRCQGELMKNKWEEVKPAPAREEWIPLEHEKELKALNEGCLITFRCWNFLGTYGR